MDSLLLSSQDFAFVHGPLIFSRCIAISNGSCVENDVATIWRKPRNDGSNKKTRRQIRWTDALKKTLNKVSTTRHILLCLRLNGVPQKFPRETLLPVKKFPRCFLERKVEGIRRSHVARQRTERSIPVNRPGRIIYRVYRLLLRSGFLWPSRESPARFKSDNTLCKWGYVSEILPSICIKLAFSVAKHFHPLSYERWSKRPTGARQGSKSDPLRKNVSWLAVRTFHFVPRISLNPSIRTISGK